MCQSCSLFITVVLTLPGDVASCWSWKQPLKFWVFYIGVEIQDIPLDVPFAYWIQLGLVDFSLIMVRICCSQVVWTKESGNSLFTSLHAKLTALKTTLFSFVSSSREMWYGSGISQNGLESVNNWLVKCYRFL